MGLLFDLGACLDKGLDSDLDQGLTIRMRVDTCSAQAEMWLWEISSDEKEKLNVMYLKDSVRLLS